MPDRRIVELHSVDEDFTRHIVKNTAHLMHAGIGASNERKAARGALESGGLMPDGTIYVGISPDTGRALYAMPDDDELQVSFNQASERASGLNEQNARGHDDWHVPTQKELELLHEIRDKDFLKNTFGDWHWSSTPCYGIEGTNAALRFEKKLWSCGNNRYDVMSVRYVRS